MATHHSFSVHSLSLSFLLSSVLITFVLVFGQHGHTVSDSSLRRTDAGGGQDMGHGAAIFHSKTIEEAKSLIEQTLQFLREINRNRLQNPRLNKLEFPPAVTPDASHLVSLVREGSWRRDTTNSTAADYFVPDKLIRAAAIVAELTKHRTASTEQQQATVASLKARHWSAKDDANHSLLLF